MIEQWIGGSSVLFLGISKGPTFLSSPGWRCDSCFERLASTNIRVNHHDTTTWLLSGHRQSDSSSEKYKPNTAPSESYDGYASPTVACVRGLRRGRRCSRLAASHGSQGSVWLEQLWLWQHMVKLTGATGWSWLHRGLSWSYAADQCFLSGLKYRFYGLINGSRVLMECSYFWCSVE